MRRQTVSSASTPPAQFAKPLGFFGRSGKAAVESVRKAFDMDKPSASLPDLLVGRVLLKNWRVGLPEIAEALFFTILRWNFCPEPSTGLCRAVSDHEGDDLPRSAAQRHLKPAFVRPLANVSPALVEFEDIAFFGRLDLISYWFGSVSFF